MAKQIPTTERLAKALEELGDPKLADMIKRAREGYYDDYKATILDPDMELVHELRTAGHPHMAARVQDGEWDAQDWEKRDALVKEARDLLRREWPGGKKRKVDTI